MTSNHDRQGTSQPAPSPPSRLSNVDLTGLVRSLAAEPTVEEAMRRLTEYTVEHIPAADAAGLTVPTSTGPATRAATMTLADTVDALQYALGGPCVSALLEPDAVQHADDLDAEDRWPEFANAAVQQTPVRSVLSYRLAVDQEHPIGSLNLYATGRTRSPRTPSARLRDLAGQATIALAYLTERQTRLELDAALHTNRRIGAALGILMARHRLTHEQAFLRLRQESQNSNRKLRDLAEDILETSELPATSRPAPTRRPRRRVPVSGEPRGTRSEPLGSQSGRPGRSCPISQRRTHRAAPPSLRTSRGSSVNCRPERRWSSRGQTAHRSRRSGSTTASHSRRTRETLVLLPARRSSSDLTLL